MLRSLAVVFLAGAFAVACGGDGTGERSTDRGPAVGPQRPPSNAQAPENNPQQPPWNETAPPSNEQAPPPNPQQPPLPESSGGSGLPPAPGGGNVVETCRVRCDALVGDCGNGCRDVCRGLRPILEACQAEVQRFFACFADVGVECSDGDVELPSAECVQRLAQAGQISQRCLTALIDE